MEQIGERIIYAFLAALVGAAIGVACWWLYGLAHSLNYSGPGMDPVLRHWVVYAAGTFGALGFVLRQHVADFLGDAINGILHFEINESPGAGARVMVGIVFLAIIIAAIWHTTPK